MFLQVYQENRARTGAIIKLLAQIIRELLHHGRRVEEEEKTEIRVISGETNLILRIETYQL